MAGARKWMGLLMAALSFALALVPLASASSEASSGGQFSIGAVAPEVTSITFYNANKSSTVTAAVPQNKYWIEIGVSDANSIDDISNITVYLYYTTNSSSQGAIPASVSPSDFVILKYVRTAYSGQPGTWAFYYSNGTKIGTSFGTWEIVNQSDPSDWGATTGTFGVEIVVGKTAHEANDGIVAGDWEVLVKAVDNEGLVGNNSAYGYAVDWYGEIWVTNDFTFGTVKPGTSNNPINSTSSGHAGYLDVYVVSNGNYDINVKTNATWVGANTKASLTVVNSTATLGLKQIRVKINSTDNATAAMMLPTSSYANWLVDQTGPTEDGSASSGQGAHHYAYLWLDVGTGVPVDSYTGEVYFQVTNA